MEEVLNTPVKETWLKELKELEEKMYGIQTPEESGVGEKRNIIDLTSE